MLFTMLFSGHGLLDWGKTLQRVTNPKEKNSLPPLKIVPQQPTKNFPAWETYMAVCVTLEIPYKRRISPIQKQERNWDELTFAKTSGTVTSGGEKIGQ